MNETRRLQLRGLVGQTLDGKYYLREWKGGGEFGAVFLASEVTGDHELPGARAVKVIPLDQIGDAERIIDEVIDEVKALASLNHPNILRYYTSKVCSLGKGSSCLYIVTEAAEENLRERFARGLLPPGQARKLVEDLAHGLACMHDPTRHNPPDPLVHFDLKPENILRVGRDWKIADFGLARLLGEVRGHRATQAMGSPDYAPPEAYGREPFSIGWDMWSLGVIIVEAITGRHPFGAANSAAARRNTVLNSEPLIPNSVLEPFAAIVRRCLMRSAGARITAQQVLNALKGAPPPPGVAWGVATPSRTLRFGILGTNNVGKTSLFGMLSHPHCRRAGEPCIFADDDETQVRLQEILEQICESGFTVATEERHLDNLRFTLSGRGNKWRVVTFDYAGENVKSQRRQKSKEEHSEMVLKSLCGCDAILVFVDASAPTMDHLGALDRMRRKLSTEPEGRGRAFPPVALVFTKADALNVSRATLRDGVVSRMQQDDVGRSVLAIAGTFPEMETFAVSAYGRTLTQGIAVKVTDLSPIDILEPFLWAAEKASDAFPTHLQRALEVLGHTVNQLLSNDVPLKQALDAIDEFERKYDRSQAAHDDQTWARQALDLRQLRDRIHQKALEALGQTVNRLLSSHVPKKQALDAIDGFEREYHRRQTVHNDQTWARQTLYLGQLRGRIDQTYTRRAAFRAVAMSLLLATILAAVGATLVATARARLQAVLTFADRNPNESQAWERAKRRQEFLKSPWANSWLLGGKALAEQQSNLAQDVTTARVSAARGQLQALQTFADQNRDKSKASERVHQRETFLASSSANPMFLGEDALAEQRQKLDEDRNIAVDYSEEVESAKLLAMPIGDGQALYKLIDDHIRQFPRLHDREALMARRDEASRQWFADCYQNAKSGEESRNRPLAEVAQMYGGCATLPVSAQLKDQARRSAARLEKRVREEYARLKKLVDAAAVTGSFDFSDGLKKANAYLSYSSSTQMGAPEVIKLRDWLNSVTGAQVPATVTIKSWDVPYWASVRSMWAASKVAIETNNYADSKDMFVQAGLGTTFNPPELAVFKGRFGAEPQLAVHMSLWGSTQSASSGVVGLLLYGSSTVNLVLRNAQSSDDPAAKIDLLVDAPDLCIKKHVLPNLE
jgi:serine/threonine protein kinase